MFKNLLLVMSILFSSQAFSKDDEAIIKEEKYSTSLKRCGVNTLPEGLLGAGLIFLSTSPLAPVVGLGYYGYKYYQCVGLRQEIDPYKLNLAPVIKKVRAEAEKELVEVCSEVATSLNDKKSEFDASVSEGVAKIRQASEAERNSLKSSCSEGQKAADRLRQEIETIKKGSYQIIKEVEVQSELEYEPLTNKKIEASDADSKEPAVTPPTE